MARRLPWSPNATPGPQDLVVVSPGRANELDEVLIGWLIDPVMAEQTVTRMSETVTRFADRLRVLGVASFTDVTVEVARGFVLAPLPDGRAPEVHTQHARRTALRVLYRTLRLLGYTDGDPTLDLVLAPRGSRVARPLSEDEVILCRASAQAIPGRDGSVRATAWALGEATAVSSEITQVRIGDLDHVVHPTCVVLPGTKRVRARTAPLSPWGRLVLAARARGLLEAGASPDTLLAYGGAAPAGGPKAQASVCNALRDVLDAAGLSNEPDVRPSSLRHWAGRAMFDAGAPIDQVAVAMGHRSLDAAAEDIAWDWAGPDRQEVGR